MNRRVRSKQVRCTINMESSGGISSNKIKSFPLKIDGDENSHSWTEEEEGAITMEY